MCMHIQIYCANGVTLRIGVNLPHGFSETWLCTCTYNHAQSRRRKDFMGRDVLQENRVLHMTTSYHGHDLCLTHDDVIKWKYFPRYWSFVRGIHQSPVNPQHKGEWRGALMFSLICVWINGWVINREAGDLRRHRAHYDVIIMLVHCEGTGGLPLQMTSNEWFDVLFAVDLNKLLKNSGISGDENPINWRIYAPCVTPF